jgi:phosphoglycerol transferase MdoB-like AlkP superfamily enzyme
VAAIFAVDIALYAAWGFRIDANIFFYMQSPGEVTASVTPLFIIRQALLMAVYAVIIYLPFSRFILHLFPDGRGRPMPTVVFFLVAGGMMFVPIRGGVTTSTANVGMVYFSDDQFLNHSAINPVFSLASSLENNEDFASKFQFFPDDERKDLVASLLAGNANGITDDHKPELLNTDRPNVLLIILESFSANVIEAVGGKDGITPNINRLAEEGVLFSNFYANSFRTDRGLVAILNGYFAQPTTSVMKYPSKSRTLPSIAKSLAANGYDTDMLYGGDINFTNMKSYFFSSGYDRITADTDFPVKTRLSKWGANDDVTFSHLYDEIAGRDTTSAWFTTFLTLSSHEPFEVPYHHLEHPYLNSVAFTDSCLGSFIDRIRQTPAWKNMLVILVADHGYLYPETIKGYAPKRFHIPMLWLGGALSKPAVIDTIACQTDIAATLLSLMNITHDDFLFSNDVFSRKVPPYAFYTFPNGFGFIDGTGASVYDNSTERPLLQTPVDSSAERLMKGKALLQTLYEDLGRR